MGEVYFDRMPDQTVRNVYAFLQYCKRGFGEGASFEVS